MDSCETHKDNNTNQTERFQTMRNIIRFVGTPLSLALFAVLIFGAPIQARADCNTAIGLTNGDFEYWPPGTVVGNYASPPNGWFTYNRAGTTPYLEEQSTGVEHGTYYVYLLDYASTSDKGGLYQNFTCNPGSTYSIAGWVKKVHADVVCTVKASPNAVGATYASATQIYTLAGTSSGSWVNFSGNLTASGTSMTVWLDYSMTGTKTSHVLAYDNITVTKVSDPPPTKLVYTAVPVYGYVGVPFSVTVQAQDASGNPQCTTSDTTVTLSVATGSGTLSGTVSGVMLSGSSSVIIATPMYSAADTATFTAAATAGMTLTSATSAGIPFVLPQASQLVYTAVPTYVNVGYPFAVTVQAQDSYGVVWPVTTDTTITITKASGAGTLGGTTTTTMSATTSSATVSGMTFDTPGAVTLTATASGGTPALSPVTSGNIYFRNVVNEPIYWATTSGAWDGASLNWTDSSFPPQPSQYADDDDVVFEDTLSGASPITVTLAGTFYPNSVTVNNSAKYYAITSGAIAGGTGLLKQGTGVLSLGGANTYTGPTELSGGTLIATNAAALGTGTLTIDTLANTLELDNNVAMNVGRNTTISASITINSGRLTSGAGVTHTLGTLSIGANTLSVAQGPNVTGTAGLTFGAATQTGAVVYNLGSGTLLTLASLDNGGFSSTYQGAGKTTVTGPAIGSGTVIMNGAGTVSLNGVNTCSGGMTVSSGTLHLGSAAGTSTSSGAVSVSGGGVLDLGTSAASLGSGAGDVTLNNGILQTEDVTSYALLPGTRNLILGASGGTVNMNGAAGQLLVFGNTISGSSATLTVINPGELRLYAQHNTFNKLVVLGSVISSVDRGTISLGTRTFPGYNDTLGAVPVSFTADAITLSNATYNVNVANVALDPNQGITLKIGGGGTNMLSSASGITNCIPSVISGSGPLSIIGGYVIFGGANTFSGNTRIIGGTLFCTNGYALQSTTVDLNGADGDTLKYDDSVPEVTWGGVMGTRNLSTENTTGSLTNVNIGYNNLNTTWGGHLNNAPVGVRLTKIGTATLTLTNTAYAYTGDTTVKSGTLKLSVGYTCTTSSFVIAGGAALDVSTLNTAIALASGQNLTGSGTASSGTITVAASKGLTLNAASALKFTAYNGAVPPLTVSGTGGSLVLAAANPVTVTVANGGNPLPAGSYELIAASGSATVSGAAPTSVTVNGDGIGSLTASLRITAGQLWMDVTCSSVTISSVTPVNVSCLGANNGSITVAASGGTGNYSFSKDGGATWVAAASPYAFTGLTPGSYTVWVKDDSGCVAIFASNPVVITQPATAVTISAVSSTNVSCFGGTNGSITGDRRGRHRRAPILQGRRHDLECGDQPLPL